MVTVLVNYGISDVKYAFLANEGDFKVGDVVKSSSYTLPMTVVDVIDFEYKYVNTSTGDLTTAITSTKCVKLKKLISVKPTDIELIYAEKVDK